MEEIDKLANDLVEGRIACDSCEGLSSLVDEVRSGKISLETFKQILRDSLKDLDGFS
jgi:hypothetical protein